MFDTTRLTEVLGQSNKGWITHYYLDDQGECVAKHCSRCRVVLPRSAYGANKHHRYGISNACRTCRSHYSAIRHADPHVGDKAVAARNRQRSEEELRDAAARLHPDGKKICKRCRQTLDLNAYNRDRGNGDGLSGACRECRRGSFTNWRYKPYEDHWRAQGIPFECYVCQGPYEDVEHIIPTSHPNGHDVPENTLPSCVEHNRGANGKFDKDLTAWLLSRRDLPHRGEVLARVVKYGVWPSGNTTPQEFMKQTD